MNGPDGNGRHLRAPSGPVGAAPAGRVRAPGAAPAPWAAIGTAPPPARPAHARSGTGALGRTARVVVVVVVVGAALFGGLLRAWLLAHLPLFGDEAVVGLMTQAIASGHFSTFYWGQHYGGLEPYLATLFVKAVNGGPVGLNVTASFLVAVAALVVAAIVHEATGSGRLGALAGALVWVWPYAVVWNSVHEFGFREAALVCGLVMVWCALQIHRTRPNPWTYAVLGLAGGLGWWASPEIVYFVVPTAVLLVASWRRLWRKGGDPPLSVSHVPVVLAALGALLGALPWIYTNVRGGFESVRPGALPSSGGVTYGGRLSVVVHDVVPTQLGLRTVPGGAWVFGAGPVVSVLCVVVVLAAAAWSLYWAVRRGRSAAPMLAAAVAVVAFPFIAAAFPTSSYWIDGRYGLLLPPLVVVLLALALAGPPLDPAIAAERLGTESRRLSSKRAMVRATRGPRRLSDVTSVALVVASLVVVLGGAATLAAAHEGGGVPVSPARFFSGWSDPNAPARQVIDRMEAEHLTTAYGDYWTAYVLDFLAPGRVAVSPSPLDYDRWPAMAARVAAARHPAWLFFAPGQTAAAAQAFSNPEVGPGPYSEASFEALLAAEHVPYRVVHLGVLDAVVPARRVVLAPAPAR
ncbi:MAG: hypothetical protein ACLP9C_02520 [Acidimicrobiales bacterium]